ncbi:MAG TPA: M20/M25/M40 family metallo-hydrolase [Gemmatimonadales bacterium]|nr:M20/M25/M40 family metallo-hydrolase [Gemmatimonadales bacterium]
MQAAGRWLLLGALIVPAEVGAQAPLPLKRAPARTQTSINTADLMTRVYLYADDSMMGRAAGTVYNLKATAYIESEVRRLKLMPGGDSGTFFQNVPLVTRGLDATSAISIDGTSLKPWDEFVARDPGRQTRPFDGSQAIYAGVWPDSNMITPEQAAGKFIVLGAHTGPDVPQNQQINRGAILGRYRTAAGIAVVALETFPPQAIAFFRQPQTTLRDATPSPTDTVSIPLYVYTAAPSARLFFGAPLDSVKVGTLGKTVRGSISFTDTPAPARNVVAILPGSDPKLKGEYVAIGAHSDHEAPDGPPVDHDSIRAFNEAVRSLQNASPTHQVSQAQRQQIQVNMDSLRRLRAARVDSIFNGADDDASGTTAVLEIAEALAGARVKPKRSIIFVWHTAEELGLFGARYFTDHPTVERDSIVAQLNLDMVGRGRAGEENNGGPGYLQLIGTRRLSTELGDLVETVNKQRRQPFTFDYQYDASGHPEQFYCRSDHYMYARYGIPVAFFTTGGHGDYHQVTDEPQYIDYEKLRNVTQFVHDIAVSVANLDHRVVVDKPKPNPRGQCVQ